MGLYPRKKLHLKNDKKWGLWVKVKDYADR
jgi:hypothetical protein